MSEYSIGNNDNQAKNPFERWNDAINKWKKPELDCAPAGGYVAQAAPSMPNSIFVS